MAKNEPPVHITAHRSWWDGRLTALCGATVGGREPHDVYILWSPSPKCRECRDIARGKRPMPESAKKARKKL